VRHFLGQKMPTWQCLAMHVCSILPPDLQYVLCPPDIPPGTPECQEGAGNFFAPLSVSLVVDQVDTRSGAIVLAGSVNGRRIKTGQVFGQGVRRMGLRSPPERVA